MLLFSVCGFDLCLQHCIRRNKLINHITVTDQIVVQVGQFALKFAEHILILHLRGQFVRLCKNGTCNHLDKLLVDALLYRRYSGIRNLGCNRIPFFILIICDRRILKVLLEHIIHTVCKAIADDDSRVVISVPDTFKCGIRILKEHPSDLGILLQFLHNFIAHVLCRSIRKGVSFILRHDRSDGMTQSPSAIIIANGFFTSPLMSFAKIRHIFFI